MNCISALESVPPFEPHKVPHHQEPKAPEDRGRKVKLSQSMEMLYSSSANG